MTHRSFGTATRRRFPAALLLGCTLIGGCAHGAAHQAARDPHADVVDDHAEPPPPSEGAAAPQAERSASPSTTAGTGTAGNQRACELAVYFDSNSARLDAPARARLDEVAECIRRREIDHALIEGHTDKSESEQKNRELGLARARAVAEYLKARGVPDDQIRVRSKGSTTAAGSEALWPVERRAAVDLEKK